MPSGFSIRNNVHPYIADFDFDRLYCAAHINVNKAQLSAGTLGAGNHFIEVDQDTDNNTYLVIHSGSRHLGKEVTEYYLKEGQKLLKSQNISIPYELTYLEGMLKDFYIHDLTIVQEYARISRETLDEAPFAYRDIADMKDAIGDTVNIDKVIHPIYNYKASK